MQITIGSGVRVRPVDRPGRRDDCVSSAAADASDVVAAAAVAGAVVGLVQEAVVQNRPVTGS